jgi:methylated-DNA-protein-cysteine methyltransferase-like protein
MNKSFYEKVYETVKKIPKGKVISYGGVASLLGKPNCARAVGYALKNIPLNEHPNVPWHRVINSKGIISIKSYPGSRDMQKKLLEDEGVIPDEKGIIDFKKYGWI